MPTYLIEGKKVRAEKPLTDAEIDEIASSIKPKAAPKPMLPGDRATGFRELVAEAGTPEERLAMAQQGLQYGAALAAPAGLGMLFRAAGPLIPAARTLATAVESGGFKSGLAAGAPKIAELGMRGVGGAVAGGAAIATAACAIATERSV